MSYLQAQDGWFGDRWDWLVEAWTGRSAPPSIINVPAFGFTDQFSTIFRKVGDLRGYLTATQVRSQATGAILYMGPNVPAATCDDVKEVWSKFGKRVVAFAYHFATEDADLKLTGELEKLGNSASCWLLGGARFSDNQRFWPLLRRVAILANSGGAVPTSFQLAFEATKEAASEAATEAGKAGAGAAWAVAKALAPWVAGGVALTYAFDYLKERR
jgi:hypothetical protein